jgi:glucose-1-phosphatase
MKQINTVLFDLGNVIAYIDFSAFWRDLGFHRQEEIVPFADAYKALTLQYETGKILTKEYLDGLQAIFNNRFSRVELEQAYTRIILEPVEGVADIIKRISRIHQTALVSDTNEIHYKLSLKKFEALHLLHKHYLSYQLHVMKPAQSFYDAIIQNQGIDPSHMLFIDDLETNVKGAQMAGMQALRFENSDKLENALKTFGVL